MRTCKQCGARVTPRFARVFGDNDDEIHGCPNCTTFTNLFHTEGARARSDQDDP